LSEVSTPGPAPTYGYRRRRGVHQWLALIVGIVYLGVGIAGFAMTGFDVGGFDEWTVHDESQTLLWFTINPLHNAVHAVIGLLGILLWPTSPGARIFGWILAIGYGAAFVYGLIVQGDPDRDLLNLNDADNWLHLGSAIVGLLIAVWPAPRARVEEYPPPTPGAPTYGSRPRGRSSSGS
jgi:Domain of unknown function (DUF4383)